MRILTKYLWIATLVALIVAPITAFATEPMSIKTTFQVNTQEKTSYEGYLMNDDLYFKLLDLGALLNGSDKQFCIEWNNIENSIKITPQKAYVSTNNKLFTGVKNGASTVIFKDFKITIRTHIANSEVYVNLRDLMQWLNVGIDYEASAGKLNLNTKEYLLPKAKNNPFKGSAETIDNKYLKDYGRPAGTIHQETHRVYNNGIYYITYHGGIKEYKPIDNQEATSSIKDLGDYDASNLQIYGDKMYFETNIGSAATHQDIWCSNLNGTQRQQIIKNTISSNGQSMTLYKGKIYVCTYTPHKDNITTVKRYSLNGTFEKDIVSDKMIGSKPFRMYSFRSYSIFNDNIYYIAQNGKLCSVNIDGTNKTELANLSANDKVYEMVCAYDNYVYYITNNGLFRVKIDGKDIICILPKRNKTPFAMANISIYGDKIAYPEAPGRFGVVNTDGTGRVALPNSMYDVTSENARHNQVCILNSDFTLYNETELLYNDPKKEGYVKLWAYGKDSNRTAWMPSSTPYIYNIKYKQGCLSDGTYYIKPAKATNYSLGISAASKDDKAKLILWEHKGNDNRKFIIKSSGKGTYSITPKHSGKPLSSNDKIGAVIYQGTAYKWECKAFEIIKENDAYKIKDELGNYFGVAGGKMKNDTEVIIWTKSTGGSQDFIFEKID